MNPYARIDVPKLLDRLGIKFSEVGGGRRLSASCPNPAHQDARASWFIRDNPGEPYHAAHACQGCGFRGGPNALVGVVMGLEGGELREWLSDLNAPPPLPARMEHQYIMRRAGLNEVFFLPPCVEFRPFDEWPEKHRVYLAGRRVGAESVEVWNFGFVEKCRCFKRRHRDRIVLPVFDERGALCSYTMRAAGAAQPKYLEPLTAERARPAVFGSQLWREKKILVLVEGGFDAVAVDQVATTFEEELAVGAMRGSAPTPITLARVAQFELVVALSDPDGAGQKAREKIIAACGRHTNVRTCVLPDKTDPAKLAETDYGFAYLRSRLKGMISK